MKFPLFTIIILLLSTNLFSQNIGQEGDTLKNYTDINGLKQGYWEKKYSNGEIEYTGYFIDNKPVGEFKRYDKYGNLYAFLINDTTTNHSRATFYHRNGKVIATGNYIGHNKDSIWNYYDGNDILYLQESYKNGKKDGTFKRYSRERVLLEEINWKDDVRNGVWRKYYYNGIMMWEGYYVNGKLEGEAKVWNSNGKLYKKGSFKNDLMEGIWTKYDEHGNIIKQYKYINGICPELEDEQNEMLKEMQKSKGKFPEPKNMNDIDWLRGRSGDY